MVVVTLHCGQCPAEKTHTFDSEDDLRKLSAVQLISAVADAPGKKWVIQQNGSITDTYCSKKCAI